MAKVALLQLDIQWEDPAANAARVGALTEHLQPGDVDLLILPETWCCGFTMNANAHRFAEAGLSAMKAMSKRLDCPVLGTVPAPAEEGQENRLYWVENGEIVDYYAKIKTFTYAGEHEKFRSGKTIKHWDIAGFQLTPFICYDLRFPELVRAAVPKANLVIYPANWPKARAHHWRALLAARAVENLTYVIGLNRVGVDGNGLEYSGDTMVYAPDGSLILDGGHQEKLWVLDLDPEAVREARTKWPFLNDRGLAGITVAD